MTAQSNDDSRAAVVRWRGETTGRLRAAFRHVVAGTFALVGLCVLALLALVVVSSATGGAPVDQLVIVAVGLLFGGPFALLYLVALRDRISLAEFLPYELDLNPWYVLLGMPVGALLLLSWVLFPPVGFVYLLGAPFVWGAIAARDSGGELDVEAGTLTRDYGGAEAVGPADVRQLRSHSSWRVGRYRLVRLRYRGTAILSRPTLLVVPVEDYGRIDSALSAVETRDYGVEVTETSPVAKAFLAGFGLLFVAVAAGLFLSVGDSDPRVAVPALLMASFGVLFVGLAWLV
ncbi:hypothetical protein [Halogeometricum limi]|uniref:Uncharacterized protein n=1 Tax=Halogeometricum limi TaxID=555875 RepID=A0A1I6IUL5_9EURY|nr:hypothetical protein [Halogeometricum limi]SFR69900.1 hypothetical protein SAMN04488124_3624 [Halogeometricum limi]